jgi:hydroxylamine reductase (hybrid-cluster protein)
MYSGKCRVKYMRKDCAYMLYIVLIMFPISSFFRRMAERNKLREALKLEDDMEEVNEEAEEDWEEELMAREEVQEAAAMTAIQANESSDEEEVLESMVVLARKRKELQKLNETVAEVTNDILAQEAVLMDEHEASFAEEEIFLTMIQIAGTQRDLKDLKETRAEVVRDISEQGPY